MHCDKTVTKEPKKPFKVTFVYRVSIDVLQVVIAFHHFAVL